MEQSGNFSVCKCVLYYLLLCEVMRGGVYQLLTLYGSIVDKFTIVMEERSFVECKIFIIVSAQIRTVVKILYSRPLHVATPKCPPCLGLPIEISVPSIIVFMSFE